MENLRVAEISREHRQAISGKANTSMEHLRKQQTKKKNPKGDTDKTKVKVVIFKIKDTISQTNSLKLRPRKRRKLPANANSVQEAQSIPESNVQQRTASVINARKKDTLLQHVLPSCHMKFIKKKILRKMSLIRYTLEKSMLMPLLNDDFWSADINVNSKPTQFELDSGSKITVKYWLNKVKLENCTTEFRGPGSVNLSHLVLRKITNAELKIQDRRHREDVFVMKNQPKNLLSKDAIKALRLLKPEPEVYNVETSTEFTKEFPELFKGLGLLKDKNGISLKEEAVPVCLYTPRKVRHPLLPKIKEQLEEIEKLGIISAVSEPTEWCLGMVIVPKPGNKVMICVDLTHLNKAVKRETHPMTLVDGNLAKLQGSQIFSKLDANSGFWQIPLDQSSRLYTTFVTPFGRYCFNQLPFGVSLVPEIFRRTMSHILEGLEGVICHMDDILVHAPNQQSHDQQVRRVLK